MTSKEFYREYEADLIMNPLNHKLVGLIKKEKPFNVLEFGCGKGKHLSFLCACVTGGAGGIDLSMINCIFVQENYPAVSICQGDESRLYLFEDQDIVFTCSVLCHIENIDEIITEFKRIATHKIFLAETNDIAEPYHYPHDYESYGFKKVSDAFVSPGNGLTYYIWEWSK